MTQPVYIIAEAGVNHNGDPDLAFALVDAAVDAKADAVKFQTFKAARLVTARAEKAAYQKETTGNDGSQLDMLKKLELNEALHQELQIYCTKKGIHFLSTAFDRDSLTFLEAMQLKTYKIPSGEITNAPLLWAYAKTQGKLILSTGMSTLGDIETALAVLAHGMINKQQPTSSHEIWSAYSNDKARALLQQRMTLLHCTTQYPTPFHEVNLKAMNTLSDAFGLAVGYSDHTLGITVPIAAVARGAKIIEKHFTLDQTLPGPDHRASLEPQALSEMVRAIRETEQSLGMTIKTPQASEWQTQKVARQIIVASCQIKKGELLQENMLSTRRSNGGINPIHLWDLIGTPANADYDTMEPLQ